MQVISLIGIIVALLVILLCSMRGVSLIVSATISAIIITVTSGMTLAEGYAGYYMSGVGSFVTSMLPLFLGGLFLGSLLEHSGLAASIANKLVEVIGEKNIIVAVYIATYLMSLAGVSVFVIMFTMYPLAVNMFRKGDLPRKLIPGTIIGSAVAYQCLPGIPIAINVLASDYFGVGYSSGLLAAVVCSLLVGIGDLVYLMYEAKKCKRKGEHYEEKPGETATAAENRENLPNPWIAAIPMAVIIILMNVVKLLAWLSLYIGVVLTVVLVYKKLDTSVMKVLGEGAQGSINVLITGALSGLGTLVAATSGYTLIADFLEKYTGNPYVYAFIAVAVVCAITGSASGGVKFALSAFGDKFLLLGGNPGALARVITLSSLTFDSLPHNSAVVLSLTCCGVSYKDGYKYLFVTTVLSTLLAAAVAILISSVGL